MINEKRSRRGYLCCDDGRVVPGAAVAGLVRPGPDPGQVACDRQAVADPGPGPGSVPP